MPDFDDIFPTRTRDPAMVMADVDSWSKPWRDLVHEFGYERVAGMKDGGMKAVEAEMILENERENKDRAIKAELKGWRRPVRREP